MEKPKLDRGQCRYLSEPVTPRPRTCECGRWTPVEDVRDVVRCLVCGKPSPRTQRLQAG